MDAMSIFAIAAAVMTAFIGFIGSLKARSLSPDMSEHFTDMRRELTEVTGQLRTFFGTTQANVEAGKALDDETGVSVGTYVAIQNATDNIAAVHQRLLDPRFGDTSPEMHTAGEARMWMLASFLFAVLAAVLQVMAMFAR